MKTNRIKWTSMILCILLFLCCGCSSAHLSEFSTNTTHTEASQGIDNTNAAGVAPNAEGVSSTNTLEEVTLVVQKYLPIKIQETDNEYAYRSLLMDSYGSKLYILAYYQQESYEIADTTLHIFDMNTQEICQANFQLELPELDYFMIISMDVINADELSFDLNGYQKEEDNYSHFLYKTDMTGKCLEAVTPFPDRNTYPWNPEYGTRKIFDVPGQASYIAEWDDANSYSTLYRYDTTTGTRTLLEDNMNNLYLTALCADSDETVYYVANNYITCYDPITKNSFNICSLNDCGITTYGDCYLLINDRKELALVTINGELPGIYLLTEKTSAQVGTDEAIRLVRLPHYGMDYISKSAGLLSTMSDTIEIQVEKEDSEENAAALRDRIMAELVAGKGPELLWVTKEDLLLLEEKELLMDISAFLPEDIREQLLPGVLQLGTVDDSFIAITPEVSFHTMLASNAVWDKDNWTVEDIMQLLETEESHLEWPFVYTNNRMDYYTLFYWVFANDWENSPFVDLEHGISHFDEDTFIRALEWCKKYGKDDGTIRDQDERLQMLYEGNSIGRICYFYDGFRSFSEGMSIWGDFCHITGYPVAEGSGNYLYSEGYLAVNANATHLEEIKEFLTYLLSYERQYTVDWSPVRRDVLRDRIRAHSISGEYRIAKDINESLVIPLEAKPDGSTYIEEFMAFAESAVPQPYRPTDITSILGDEMPAFFNGDKSAEEVAAIIHNRVQLYFDENK